MSDPRYPVGVFEPKSSLTASDRAALIDQIAAVPANLRAAVAGLSESQLETPYRDGGWTLRQVAHHLPDSHMNAYIRLKFTLAEEKPTIKPYAEDVWARMADTRVTPVETSVKLLEALHERWVNLLRSLDDGGFRRAFIHPDHGEVTVDWLLQMYAWHGRHHVAHITSLRQQKGW